MTAMGESGWQPTVFRVWFPDVHDHVDETCCTFDITASGEVSLNDGTPDFCRHIADRLGFHVLRIREWSIERICTPFFTNYADSDIDWVDRFPVSWRMSIRLDATIADRCLEPGPVPITMSDSSWHWTPSFWVPGREECEVLGIEVTEPDTGSAAALATRLCGRFPDLPVTVQEMIGLRFAIRVGRIRIGRLSVGKEYQRLISVKDACAGMGLATDIPSFEHLRAKLS